jgi:hypothetical protein
MATHPNLAPRVGIGRTTTVIPPVNELPITERIFTLLRCSLSIGVVYEILVQIVGIANDQTNLTTLSNVVTTLTIVNQWHEVHSKKLTVPQIFKKFLAFCECRSFVNFEGCVTVHLYHDD